MRDMALLAPACVTLVLLIGGALAGIARTSLVPLAGEANLDAWRTLLSDPAARGQQGGHDVGQLDRDFIGAGQRPRAVRRG